MKNKIAKFYLFLLCYLLYCGCCAAFAENLNDVTSDIHGYLFVSLGMPDNTLKAYLRQAEQAHIPVVLRGLYLNPYNKNNKHADPRLGSFRDTASRLFALLQSQNAPAKKILPSGVLIDPLWYQNYHIRSVPALVVAHDVEHFDVVFGNIPLKSLIKLVADKSPNQSRAVFSRTLWASL